MHGACQVAVSSHFTDETMEAKDVCDWLESQDEDSGLTAQPMLVSPPPSLPLA